MISSNGNDFQPSFTTGSNQKVFFRCETLEMILTKMISNVLEMRISCQKKHHFHLEMIFLKLFTATKNDFWLFLGQKNDLQVRKIISFQFGNDFLHKKMISKELKNDFREMIFGTFCAGFEDVIYSWEKNHFLRKWAFPEMDGNHFFPENARQPPKKVVKTR